MPRAGLTPEVVAIEAARVADDCGFDRLTLAAVAARLGVRLPSLYKHVGGLDQLRTAVATAALSELAQALEVAVMGRSGIDALGSLADAYRSYAARRPGAYAATLRAPDPQDTEHVAAAGRVLHVVLATVAGFHLRGDDAIDAVRGLRALLHGFVAIEAAGGYQMAQDLDRSFRSLVDSYANSVTSWSVRSGVAS